MDHSPSAHSALSQSLAPVTSDPVYFHLPEQCYNSYHHWPPLHSPISLPKRWPLRQVLLSLMRKLSLWALPVICKDFTTDLPTQTRTFKTDFTKSQRKQKWHQQRARMCAPTVSHPQWVPCSPVASMMILRVLACFLLFKMDMVG